MADDKRVKTRIDLQEKVEVRFDDFAAFKAEIVENISLGGMYLTSSENVRASKNIQFRLFIEDLGQELAGEGKVVWTKEYTIASGERKFGLGIQFVKLEPDTKKFIEEFVDKHVESA